MRIWNKWVADGHTERHADLNALLWLAARVQNYFQVGLVKSHSRITDIFSENGHVCSALYPLVFCDDVCSIVDCQNVDHYCGFPGQCNKERDDNSSALNDKAGYRNAIMCLFKKVFVLKTVIWWPYTCLELPRGNSRHLFTFDINIGAMYQV